MLIITKKQLFEVPVTINEEGQKQLVLNSGLGLNNEQTIDQISHLDHTNHYQDQTGKDLY